MDGIIIIIILIVVGVYFRKVDKIVMGVAIIDIFLRLFNYIISNIQINGISEYIEKYLPEIIPSIIGKYTTDIIYNILIWLYVICMAIFLGYTVKYFFKKK